MRNDRILQTCSSLFARIVDKIAENPAQYLEELMGLSQNGTRIISRCRLA